MYNGVMTGSPLSVDDVAELFTCDWRSTAGKENIRYGKLGAEGIEEQGRKLVRLAYDNVDPDEEVISVSEVFAVPVRYGGRFLSKPLVGEFDLVIRGRKDGAPVVVDWKTSATRWAKNRADKSLQATVYSYSYRLKHGINPGVRYDVAVKNVRPVFEQHSTMRGSGDWNLLSKLVAKADAIVEHSLFMPNLDSFACSSCPYAGACAEWCGSAEEPAVMAA
jgi:putative RecB family exonuclease